MMTLSSMNSVNFARNKKVSFEICSMHFISSVAVAQVFGSVMTDMGAKKVILAIQEVGPLTPGPDMAYERSTYEFLDDKGASIDNGK